VIDVSAFQVLLLRVTNWLDQQAREVLAYLIEESGLAAAAGRSAPPDHR
jgi:hypothetical protein